MTSLRLPTRPRSYRNARKARTSAMLHSLNVRTKRRAWRHYSKRSFSRPAALNGQRCCFTRLLPFRLQPLHAVADVTTVGVGVVVGQPADGLELQPSPLALDGVGVFPGGAVGDDVVPVVMDHV